MVDLQEHNGQIKYQITNGGKQHFPAFLKIISHTKAAV